MAKIWIFTVLYFILVNSLQANFVSSDEDYNILKTPFATYVYTNDYLPYLPKLLDHHQKLDLFYRKSFKHTLDEKPVIVLASLKNQIPNAFATTLPYTMSVIYPAGSTIMEEITISNWTTSVLTHEYAHLYQLNPKKEAGEIIHSIFGNHPFFLLPLIPIPIFPSPNFANPLFLLEGNSVLNESAWGEGGRAFNGFYRAMFYSLLKTNQLDETRLTNSHLDFPGYTEKYIIGAYFMIYLADRYGINLVNSFYQEQAEHYLLPLILNKTFKKHFGEDYSTLIQKFISFYSEKAGEANKSLEPPLFTSFNSTSFHQEGGKIYFLTSDEGKSYPIIRIFDVTTNEWSKKEGEYFGGKVFPIDGKFYTANESTNNFTDYHFSLWDENNNEIEKFHSHLLLDKKGDHLLTLDVKKSIDTIHLTKDFKETINADSFGLLNENGDIYSFTQKKGIRTLQKNNTALFSFHGYSSKIVAIKKINNIHDEIYYTSNTSHGQSLFAYNALTKKNERVHNSDFINNAIPLPNNYILIEEIDYNSYGYKIVKESRKEEKPYTYNFDYLINAPVENEKEINDQVELKYSYEKLNNDKEEYSSIKELKYSNWNLSYYANSNLIVNTNFIDPLEQNILTSGFTSAKAKNKDERDLFLYYLNKKFRLNYFTELAYRPVEEENDKQKPQITFGLKYPFFDINHWKMYGDILGTYLINSNHSLINYQSLELKKNVSYGNSFDPYRLYRLFPELKKSYYGHKRGLTFQTLYDVGYENILGFEGNSVYSSTGHHTLGLPLWNTPNWSSSFLYPTIKTKLEASEISSYRVTLGYKKVLNLSSYFPVFPISLRRLAPLIFYSLTEYKLKTGGRSYTFSSPERGFGLDLELLFAHNFPFHLVLTEVNRKKDNQNEFNVGIFVSL